MSHVRARRLPRAGLSRRGVLTAGGALALGALLAACADDDGGAGTGTGEGNGAGGEGGPWSFTDDRDETASADAVPQRIVAYIGSAAALHDFGITDQVVGVFGPTVAADGSPDPLAGDVDVDRVTVLGNAWGEFNLEQYVELEPELLVTDMWVPGDLWYVPEDSAVAILELAPSVGITVANVTLQRTIERYEELAGSLGADLSAAAVVDARDRFAQAAETLRAAAEANGGLRVMAASASADLLYISDPQAYTDLSYFQELGVELVEPEAVTGGFFEHLSWENADKYDADLILLDSRTSALQPGDLGDKATWANLPAVQAGQITPWLSEPRFSYQGAAPLLEQLAAAIEGASTAA